MINNLTTYRVFWMLDEVIGQTKPHMWGEASSLSSKIVGKVGRDGYDHELVNPVDDLKKLSRELEGQQFSCVLDLTGWLSPTLRDLFPEASVIDTFSMSRVRKVSSPRLETTGHLVSMSIEDVQKKRDETDLTRPLIVDDTTFSGWTSRKTMDIWGIDPENATHAFLMANMGTVNGQTGGINTLRSMGGKVFYGLEIRSPEDDSWHVKDLCQAVDLEKSIDLSLRYKKMLDEKGLGSDVANAFISSDEAISALFPERFTTDQIRDMIKDGRFVPVDGASFNEDEIHARNPFLWASPYFHDYVDMNKLGEYKREITQDLIDLRALISDPDGKIEASIGFRKEIEADKINRQNPEGSLKRGVER